MPASRPNGRPRASCAQCRQSKIKCDKVFPCAQCVRQGCGELCPDAIRQVETSTAELLKQIQELKGEVEQLRRRADPLPIFPNGIHSLNAVTSHLPGPSTLASHPLRLTTVSDQPSIGHLSVDPREGSRFLGPTAAAHLLPAEDEESGVVTLAAPEAPQGSLRMAFPFRIETSTSAFVQARAQLPPLDRCLELCRVYFEQTTWRFAPVSRQYCDGMFNEVFSNDETAQPAQLAVVLGILAVGCLFDSGVPAHSAEAKSYHELSLHCLGLADFLSHISTATLVSLHLHCCFLINDDRPRTEEIYAIVGLALRLAIIAGFHKDGSWWGLPEDEANARRRIWWEILTLERINSNRFGCPPFIQADRFDAIPPMDEPADGFMAWRWEWDNCLHRLINVIQGHPTEESNVEQKNEILRSYWSRLPTSLKSGLIDQVESDHGRSLDTLEQIRLALHYSTGLLQCHRSSFQQSLKTHQNEPLESPSSQSVLAVIGEACPFVVKLVEELYQGHGVSYTRHIVAALDVFSAIVPLAAIIIRSPRSRLSIDAHGYLLRGVTLLELASEATPCPSHSMLLARGRSMASKATTRLARRWDPPTVPTSPAFAPPILPLGNMVDPLSPDLDSSESDFDFDQWLNSLWEPLSAEQPSFQA